MARVDDLRADYERLGEILRSEAMREAPSAAASIVRERRMIAIELEKLETTEGQSFVDELASRRTDPGDRRPSGRRKSG